VCVGGSKCGSPVFYPCTSVDNLVGTVVCSSQQCSWWLKCGMSVFGSLFKTVMYELRFLA
jgi:hypothetical protein